MDFINKLKGSDQNDNKKSEQEQKPEEGSHGIMDKINNAMGGGKQGENNEDFVDKAVDWAQERMGQGPQDNESAFEQAKDERISDAIRTGFKKATGHEIPVKDKS